MDGSPSHFNLSFIGSDLSVSGKLNAGLVLFANASGVCGLQGSSSSGLVQLGSALTVWSEAVSEEWTSVVSDGERKGFFSPASALVSASFSQRLSQFLDLSTGSERSTYECLSVCIV